MTLALIFGLIWLSALLIGISKEKVLLFGLIELDNRATRPCMFLLSDASSILASVPTLILLIYCSDTSAVTLRFPRLTSLAIGTPGATACPDCIKRLSIVPENGALTLVLDVGEEYGALGSIVSGSGPTVAFLVADEEQGLDLAVALTSSGVVGSVARAYGPVHGAKVI